MAEDNGVESINYLLDVYTHKAKEFMDILSTMAFRECCWLRFYANGLKLIVDDEVELQSNAYFKIEFFSEYNIRANELTIYIRSKTLLQAMKTFHDPTFSARFIYKTTGDPLEIHLESSAMVVHVTVPTNMPAQMLNIHCDNSSLPVKILFTPTFLHQILSSLDKNVGTVKLEFYPDKFRLETIGEVFQRVEIKSCDENADDFLVVSALDSGVLACFRTEHLRKMLGIIKIAKRVAMKVDSNGVLCFQIMVQHDEETTTFIEFLVFRTISHEETAVNMSHTEMPNW